MHSFRRDLTSSDTSPMLSWPAR